MQGDGGQGQGSEETDGDPEKTAREFWHEGYKIWRRVSGEYCGEKAPASQARRGSRRASQLLYHREHKGAQGKSAQGKADSPSVSLFPCVPCGEGIWGG